MTSTMLPLVQLSRRMLVHAELPAWLNPPQQGVLEKRLGAFITASGMTLVRDSTACQYRVLTGMRQGLIHDRGEILDWLATQEAIQGMRIELLNPGKELMLIRMARHGVIGLGGTHGTV